MQTDQSVNTWHRQNIHWFTREGTCWIKHILWFQPWNKSMELQKGWGRSKYEPCQGLSDKSLGLSPYRISKTQIQIAGDTRTLPKHLSNPIFYLIQVHKINIRTNGGTTESSLSICISKGAKECTGVAGWHQRRELPRRDKCDDRQVPRMPASSEHAVSFQL